MRIESINLDLIRPSATNPRKHFDAPALEELAETIRQMGVLEPLLVRPVLFARGDLGKKNGVDQPSGHFELVAGERRFRAAKIAGLAEVPCRIVTTPSPEGNGK